jgi:hypothetical protein
MMTNFSVQAGVGEFYAAQRLLRDPGSKALPEAARVDGADVIALQAPACKALPQARRGVGAHCGGLLRAPGRSARGPTNGC